MFRRNVIVMDSWRSAGVTYLQSLHVTSAALQRCVKESKQAKYSKHSAPGYFTQVTDGQGGFEKVEKVPKSVEELMKSAAATTTTGAQ